MELLLTLIQLRRPTILVGVVDRVFDRRRCIDPNLFLEIASADHRRQTKNDNNGDEYGVLNGSRSFVFGQHRLIESAEIDRHRSSQSGCFLYINLHSCDAVHTET